MDGKVAGGEGQARQPSGAVSYQPDGTTVIHTVIRGSLVVWNTFTRTSISLVKLQTNDQGKGFMLMWNSGGRQERRHRLPFTAQVNRHSTFAPVSPKFL